MFGPVADVATSAANIQKQLAERNRNLPEERRVEFRIGLNLGDVIEYREDIHGDGVNLAAHRDSLCVQFIRLSIIAIESTAGGQH